MKKKILFVFIGVLVLSFALSGVASAALPGSGWWSALWVQNISDFDGAVTMTAYENSSAATFDSQTFDFAPSKSLAYDPGTAANFPAGNLVGFDTPLPTGFEGAVVLSANVPAAGVSQIANYKNGSAGGTGKATATYQGISSDMLATKLLVPSVKNNYSKATTTMYVQAAGEDADVTITYNMANGDTFTETQTINANRAYLFDPDAVGIPSTGCGSDTNTSPCYGSAIITSSAPIAGVLLEHPHRGTPVTFVQAMRLPTPQDESTRLYVPSMKNTFCGPSGCGIANAVVMNVGTEPANVKITLTVSKLGTNAKKGVKVGDVYTDTATILPGKNNDFSIWNKNLGGLPEGTIAAAVIESLNGQPLVGSSNDVKTQPNFPGQAKLRVAAYPDELTSPIAYAPIVKEFVGPWAGNVTVQNVGTAPDYMVIEYHEFGSERVCYLETINPVPVGGAVETNFVHKTGSDRFTISGDGCTFASLKGKEFSVKAYTLGGQNILLMATDATQNGTLDHSRYEGVNVK